MSEELAIKYPKGYTFAAINEFVHADVDFEDLQCALLGISSHLEAETKRLREALVFIRDGEYEDMGGMVALSREDMQSIAESALASAEQQNTNKE